MPKPTPDVDPDAPTKREPAPGAAPAGPGRGTTVAIVGRPNVGKSALFNRLAGRRISIVHDQPGVTRDRITAGCEFAGLPVTLVDTGGIGGGTEDELSTQVETEAAIAREAADLILFVVDGRDGLTPVDSLLATELHRSKRAPVFLLVNKLDDASSANAEAEFAVLNFDEVFAVSATHGRGIPELAARAGGLLRDAGHGVAGTARLGTPMRIAVVGKPNAGKSSLINAVLKDERTIVSPVAGTTRDAVDIPYSRTDRDYVLIDTAGMRRKNSRDTAVEVFSAMRTEKSIHRAHLCLLVVDCATGVTAQDRTIARAVLAASKPCVLILNKFDLYHPGAPFRDRLAELQDEIGRELFFLGYAPMVAVSAEKREHLNLVFQAVEHVRKAALDAPGTGDLNRLVQRALRKHPPPARKSGHRLKIFYATLAKHDVPTPLPVPRFVLFVNKRLYLNQNYKRYLENSIRAETPFTGLPVVFDVRERNKPGA